ncbi:MAG: tyrosine-type recombinase/integrase [Polyangiaceae bacterium]|nr:tyrosine-type recombinase/integrase [Polyangiaceae bacterium]
MITTGLPALLQRFFTDRLLGQLGASPNTVACYRDAFRLLLRFAAERLRRPPTALLVEDLNAPFLGQYLDHLEHSRGCSARTRNIRLSALHAFFRYVALEEPGHALHCQRVLAIPHKRHERRTVEFLIEEEILALLAAPDPSTWLGRRDRTLLLLAVRTGLRSSELTGLRPVDVVLGKGAHVRCHGKGRKTRCTPLRSDVVPVLASWLGECKMDPNTFVFPSSRGGRLSADALQRLVAKHVAVAALQSPTLTEKNVTPHTLRHSAAMEMLRRGIDRSVIALWLGHEFMDTTQIYLHADMRLKEQALAHATPSGMAPGRYEPEDELLVFLEAL